mmetsp:Transcript_479/g.565  ORF Transcript_479/g.565 Transcript_479/m.565 type:complete len:175 (-) Transcript_479:160-684(-)
MMNGNKILSLLFLFFSMGNHVAATYLNVYGDPLASCSTDGTALTGFTRSGECVEQDEDSGSHHVCIDLSSTTGGNFCTVTGQPNWCSSNMACNEGGSDQCPVKFWCVCEWAFASYIEKAGGCDKIQELNCKAINHRVLEAYTEQIAESKSKGLSATKYENSLACVKSRCNIQTD